MQDGKSYLWKGLSRELWTFCAPGFKSANQGPCCDFRFSLAVPVGPYLTPQHSPKMQLPSWAPRAHRSLWHFWTSVGPLSKSAGWNKDLRCTVWGYGSIPQYFGAGVVSGYCAKPLVSPGTGNLQFAMTTTRTFLWPKQTAWWLID